MNKSKEITDDLLLQTYMWGFNDELDGRTRLVNTEPILLKAYSIGRDDAIIGDEISSSDLQTNQQIISRIKTVYYGK